MRTPIRRTRSGCCAYAASGQVAADPTIALTKSRRRIAFPRPKLRDLAPQDYSRDLRQAKWGSGSGCTAAILRRSCPLWVKSGHRGTSGQCLLYPQKRTLVERVGMSALCQKRTSASFRLAIHRRAESPTRSGIPPLQSRRG